MTIIFYFPDGVFVALHDITLDDVTNVADFPEFADRKRTQTLSTGKVYTGFFVSDFTLAELKELRLHQRLNASRTTLYDNLFQVPTFDEIVANFQSKSGIYAELKQNGYFYDCCGFDMETMFLNALTKYGYDVQILDKYPASTFKDQ